jgi:hypothetical protein
MGRLAEVSMYEDFHILLDQPSQTLSLEFDDYADALAEIILNSRPRFAVGIFGDWGSGKTTLMEGISARLAGEEQVVRVFFNAWRYEREPHLLVPMLDTLRESLLDWADGRPDGAGERGLATRVAAAASRAARAVLAGITLRAGLPLGGLEASLDASKAVEAWRSESEAATRVIAGEPKSFYHASFRALREAMAEFVRGGAGRIVVFVDDLDRCLPENALQVLESMKLFFDLEGFVFVVGLDQQVIEQAVELRYQTGIRSVDSDQVGRANQQGAGGEAAGQRIDPAAAAPAATYRSLLNGANYVKKIFQVQFSVPRVVEQQLKGYVEFIAEDAKLPPPQRDHLRDVVSRHLPYLAGEGSVNPREVKRLINAYTMQLQDA